MSMSGTLMGRIWISDKNREFVKNRLVALGITECNFENGISFKMTSNYKSPSNKDLLSIAEKEFVEYMKNPPLGRFEFKNPLSLFSNDAEK